MRRHFALASPMRAQHHPARPLTCLAFVILLGAAFWAGAVWMAQTLLRLSQLGY